MPTHIIDPVTGIPMQLISVQQVTLPPAIKANSNHTAGATSSVPQVTFEKIP